MFTLPSVNASSARVSASTALQWCNAHLENQEVLKFAKDICFELDNCIIKSRKYMASTKKHEMMWGYFHQLRTQENFIEKWQNFFIITTGKTANSIIIQFLVDRIFKAIISIRFTSQTVTPGCCNCDLVLTHDEENALRYAAGYIPKCLRDRLNHSSHPLKRELMWRLLDLTDETDDTGDDESEDWINMIDWGGLTHITNKTYTLIKSMEMVLRQCLCITKVKFKEKVMENILKDEDVLFNWLMISGEWENEEAETLFKMIIELWVTIRGFSFASSWVEKYKLAHHQSIQKSKGIRKQLITGKSSQQQ